MNIELVILIIAGAFSALATFILQVKFKLGDVRASAIIGVLAGGLLLLYPNVLSAYLTLNLPLICFGASFIGMASPKVLNNYWIIGFSGVLFTLLFINSSSYINNFGGGLGAAACMALLISLGLVQIFKSKQVKNLLSFLKKRFNWYKMDEVIDEQNIKRKVYSNVMFWVGTYLGGPLVAGYFFAENFKAMNEAYKVKSVWLIAVLATVVIFSIAYLIPEDVNIPSQILPITYTALASGLFKAKQEVAVNELITNGGQLNSWWKVAGVAVIGLVFTLGFYLIVFNAADVIKFLF